jgi:hypothetical protein
VYIYIFTAEYMEECKQFFHVYPVSMQVHFRMYSTVCTVLDSTAFILLYVSEVFIVPMTLSRGGRPIKNIHIYIYIYMCVPSFGVTYILDTGHTTYIFLSSDKKSR